MTIGYKLSSGDLPTFPKYNYGAFINSPDEMGMTTTVDGWGIDTIGDNFGGLIPYIELLVSGTTNASKAVGLRNNDLKHQPLGNAYIYPSGLTCKDPRNPTQDISAMMYMNNVPLGNIPFLSSFTGDLKELRGLVPGVFEDLNGFNPREFMYAMEVNSSDTCIMVQLPITNITEDGNNYESSKPPTEYSPLFPMFRRFASLIDPCLFHPVNGVRTNPVTNAICSGGMANANAPPTEGFMNIEELPNNNTGVLLDIYFISITVLFLFIMLKMCKVGKR